MSSIGTGNRLKPRNRPVTDRGKPYLAWGSGFGILGFYRVRVIRSRRGPLFGTGHGTARPRGQGVLVKNPGKMAVQILKPVSCSDCYSRAGRSARRSRCWRSEVSQFIRMLGSVLRTSSDGRRSLGPSKQPCTGPKLLFPFWVAAREP